MWPIREILVAIIALQDSLSTKESKKPLCCIIETTVTQAKAETNVRNGKWGEITAQLINGSDVTQYPLNKVESEICLRIKNFLENKEVNESLESIEERQDPAGVQSDKKDEVDSGSGVDSSLLSR